MVLKEGVMKMEEVRSQAQCAETFPFSIHQHQTDQSKRSLNKRYSPWHDIPAGCPGNRPHFNFSCSCDRDGHGPFHTLLTPRSRPNKGGNFFNICRAANAILASSVHEHGDKMEQTTSLAQSGRPRPAFMQGLTTAWVGVGSRD